MKHSDKVVLFKPEDNIYRGIVFRSCNGQFEAIVGNASKLCGSLDEAIAVRDQMEQKRA